MYRVFITYVTGLPFCQSMMWYMSLLRETFFLFNFYFLVIPDCTNPWTGCQSWEGKIHPPPTPEWFRQGHEALWKGQREIHDFIEGMHQEGGWIRYPSEGVGGSSLDKYKYIYHLTPNGVFQYAYLESSSITRSTYKVVPLVTCVWCEMRVRTPPLPTIQQCPKPSE